jgi:hypothetical protein
MARHPQLTCRKANLITRSRATLSCPQVEFFNNFEKSAAGIPTTNIINADESNVREDPGTNKKAIFQRGVKYAEQICDHTKSCISIMFAGTVTGDFLLPFVIYKAQHCNPGWGKGDPKGAHYTATPSGWIDSFVYVMWMKKVQTPDWQKDPGC